MLYLTFITIVRDKTFSRDIQLNIPKYFGFNVINKIITTVK